MKKNKLIKLAISGLAIASVVGVTLAFFVSKDIMVNEFSFAETGVEIIEDFNPDNGVDIKPGEIVNKAVHLENSAGYDQFVRVKFTPVFAQVNDSGTIKRDEDGKPIPLEDPILHSKYIKLNFTDGSISDEVTENKWFEYDGYYYYIAKLTPDMSTSQILDSVNIDPEIANAEKKGEEPIRSYHFRKFAVTIEAESVQADSDAFQQEWGIDPNSELGKKLGELQNK